MTENDLKGFKVIDGFEGNYLINDKGTLHKGSRATVKNYFKVSYKP